MTSIHRIILSSTLFIVQAALPAHAWHGSPLNVIVGTYALEIHLDFDPGGRASPIDNQVQGRALITFRNSGGRALHELPILLNRLMRVEKIGDSHGRTLEFRDRLARIAGWESFQVTETTVALKTPLPAGEEMTLDIEYAGRQAPYVETGMSYVKETLDPAFSIFRIETFSFPVIAVADASERSPLDIGGPFDQKIAVTLPSSLDVAYGGKRTSDTTEGALRTIRYESTRPTDVLMFAIGPYEIVQAGEVRFHYLPEDAIGAKRLQTRALEALKLLDAWFGPRPRGSRGLAFIEIPEGFGSQAVAPTIIQTAAAFRDPAQIFEIYHEIGHLWNVRDLDTPSPRWNEGLSTYLQHFIDEQISGGATYERGMASIFTLAKKRLSGEVDCVSLAEFGHRTIARRQSYLLGGLFFARLQHQFGEKLFNAYGDFYQDYKETGATTEEFLGSLAESLGHAAMKEIDDWFRSCRYLDKIQRADSFEAFVSG